MVYVLGIDLGTTYSAAATADGVRADIFQLGSRAATTPSVVFLREDARLLTGEVAERRYAGEPSRGAREFKRRLGDSTPFILGGTPYGAEALMAELLRAIVASVTEQRGEPPESIAVAHPASFGPYKLDLLRQMARQAGLQSVALISEPVAAASHYASQERIPQGTVIAVYDFGGGTFDAAVLRKTDDGFEILGQPEGLERLGGIDFDEAVFAHVVETVGSERIAGDGSPAVRSALVRLREECRQAKESLSEDTEAIIPVLLPGYQSEVRLTRSELEDAIRPRIRETVAALERSVRSAGLEMTQVDRILLVGGCSRIPLVGQTVRELTGRPVSRDAHPKHAIALGAAMFASGAVPAPLEASPRLEPGPQVMPAAETALPEAPVPAPAVEQVPVSVPVVAVAPAAARLPEPPRGSEPRSTARAGLPRWVWAGGGLVAVIAIAAVAALLLGGGGGAEARITDARLSGNTYTIWFETKGFTLSSSGDQVVFFWDNASPASGATWAGGSPVTFAFSRPAGATKICIAVAPANGAIQKSSGNCWSV